MPDMNEKFPCVEGDDFANGAIQSEADSKLCVDTLGNPTSGPGLYKCHKDSNLPEESQRFALTWHRNIQNNKNYYRCFDEGTWSFVYCSYKFKRQIWYYNLTTHQILNPYTKNCLTTVISNKSLLMDSCNPDDKKQKWKWTNINTPALENWDKYGEKLPNDTRYAYYG